MIIDSVKHPVMEKIRHLKGGNLFTFILYDTQHIDWLLQSQNPQYRVEFIVSIHKKNSQWPWIHHQVKPSIFHHVLGSRYETVAIVNWTNNTESHNHGVILDHIVDFGNIGSIIRNSYMLGVKNFLIINNLNIFNSKTIDSCRGLIFFSNLFMVPDINSGLEYVKDNNIYPLIGGFGGVPLRQYGSITKGHWIVVGNETNGCHKDWQSIDHEIITIEQEDNSICDSMNVSCAAAILVYCLMGNKK